ncbi:MAG: 50S ribosomal protein L20 [Bdellovibrio sp.]|nr:50S ribosomal protein L20 [Bdellovibrio sp.]
MPRAKRGFKRRIRHKKVLKLAKGFVLGRKNKFRRSSEAVDRAHKYAFRDRRVRKREFRSIWIERLSAATGGLDLSYSRFIAALKKAGIGLNRKMLSEIAISDPTGFAQIVEQVRPLAPIH